MPAQVVSVDYSACAAIASAVFAGGAFVWSLLIHRDKRAAEKAQVTTDLAKHMISPPMLVARCQCDRWFRKASDEDIRSLVTGKFNPIAYDDPEMHGVWQIIEFFELVGSLVENSEFDKKIGATILNRYEYFRLDSPQQLPLGGHFKRVIREAEQGGTEHWKYMAKKYRRIDKLCKIKDALEDN